MEAWHAQSWSRAACESHGLVVVSLAKLQMPTRLQGAGVKYHAALKASETGSIHRIPRRSSTDDTPWVPQPTPPRLSPPVRRCRPANPCAGARRRHASGVAMEGLGAASRQFWGVSVRISLDGGRLCSRINLGLLSVEAGQLTWHD